MIELDGEYDLIEYLKKQDLTNNQVVLNIQGTMKKDTIYPPFYISGYLSDKETGGFPVGDRFKLRLKWDNMEGVENSVRNIKKSIKRE